MSWVRLEHLIWTQYKKNKLNEAPLVPLILTVSGGLDSMALLRVITQLNLKNQIIVAHFHHGKSADSEQNQYRNQALQLVKKSSEKFEFIFHKAQTSLRSEAEFRQARRQFIQSILSQYPNAIVVTGHHQNDLLETYFLKLIRGSGIQSLKNFKSFNGKIWRPFLNLQKLDLQNYADLQKWQWLEDPSNLKNIYLRNWLRRDFFPLLESKQSGAARNLLKGLDRLVEKSQTSNAVEAHWQHSLKSKDSCVIEIDRRWYMNLTSEGKEKVIFLAFKRAQVYKYEKNQTGLVFNQEKQSSFWDITIGRVKEICKQLDKNQKDLKFILGQLKALTSSEKIVLEFKL